ncbi:accessory Sec system glycosylation chaperone GtfB [Acetatifactor muris]|uniref:UDP-N-acetylglucosamine--peptide N-acetylglucosaminyltransferase stabilizing protein GtfB n=1 Tax=Acetatifactor muris TaxID=879566 RepID=A0A2K4ZEN3_9FIRM|nr:accessory Sec system glycosylation chaperone GtfB [Acetatifactor muris]MCR2048535.1 accessory Sec system glycosylation chaperone GtfB [Acetatifactor muris]SOY28927.1 Glycosyltransferase-stabilizing protein Gtf2 [Acetatifactor muris]
MKEGTTGGIKKAKMKKESEKKEDKNMIDDAILLMDNYGPDSQALHTSLKLAGFDCPAVVLEDDGFLPEDVISVYGFFLGDFRAAMGAKARPKYFNEITVPEYWEISGTNSGGKVQDLYRERGKIFYAEPKHRRLVKVVDWYDEKGVVRSSDHYNRYGALWGRTIFNSRGQKVNRTYFAADGREIIVENFVTGDIILNEDGEVRIFRNKTEFALHFLVRGHFKQSRIFFNSLSTPFFISNRLSSQVKRDILFWQEPITNEIPGNMQVIFRGEASRTATVVVQKKDTYDRLTALGAPKNMVQKLGFLYPFEKENAHRPEALICTNSDRIEHCEELVKALPQMHFHIAALTEMSSKLTGMDRYDNVSLYPGVKTAVLDELFETCDYYFDINHESEIVSAVRRAFLHNHLIFAFQETVHSEDFMAAEHIFPASEWEQMRTCAEAAMADTKVLRKMLQKQKKAALAESVESYRSLGNGKTAK